MFRKGALLFVVLSAICSALFTWWINSIFRGTILTFIMFLEYLCCFAAIFGSIYDIIHKVNVKSNKYMLGGSISAVIAFTTFFKAFQYSSIYLWIVFLIAFICCVILLYIAAKYEVV